MVPLILVLCLAQTVLSANIPVQIVPYGDAPAAGGGGIRPMIENCLDVVDGASKTLYQILVEEVIKDMAGSPDPYLQCMAIGQTINILGESVVGVPGDACAYASVVNAQAAGSTSPQSRSSFINRMNNHVKLLTEYASNPASLQGVSGPAEGCAGGGRSFNFEGGWNSIFAAADELQTPLINELYCATRRLSGSYNPVYRNMAAAVSAAATPTAVEACLGARSQALQFLSAFAGRNQQGLASAASGFRGALA